MGVYKVFDGVNWVDICDCNVYVKTVSDWQLLNAKDCVLKYWDGKEWCEVICCECPPDYIYDPVNRDCRKFEMIPATPTGGITVPIVKGDQSTAYGNGGARLYEDISGKTYPLNGWHNTSLCPPSPPASAPYCSAGFQVRENAGTGTVLNIDKTSAAANQVFTNPPSSFKSRLNIAGLWGTGYGTEEWLTVEFCINITSSKTYIFAIAGDNQIRANITSNTFNGGVTDLNLVNLWGTSDPAGTVTSIYATVPFRIWHMFPITLPAGNHIIKLGGYDFAPYVDAAFGAEVYDIPVGNPTDVWPTDQTMCALLNSTTITTTDLEPFIAFTTRDLIQTPPLLVAAPGETITWTCPSGYTLDLCNGVPACTISDVVPCGGTGLSNRTEINIWFDNSGSMNSTLSPLQIMQSTLLQACLLPIFNNDVALYNERVKIINMGGAGTEPTYERFVKCLGIGRNYNRTADATVDQVINLTFADESNNYGYGGGGAFVNTTRTPTYDADVLATRNNISLEPYTIKGCAFRVNTLNNTGTSAYPGFRGLTEATFVNSGVYLPPNNLKDFVGTNFTYQLDTVAGSTPAYYLSQITAALNTLGINVTC